MDALPRLQALIWDVDGTLAETERDAHRPAFNDSFAAAGLDWYWDEPTYGRLLAVTGGRERMRHFALEHDPAFAAAPDREARIAVLHRHKNARYAERVRAAPPPLRPGVAAMIETARAEGLRLAIATTTSRDNLDVLLRACLGEHALSWFEVTVCGEDVARKKPDPEVYLEAVARLGVPATACVAFEDSLAGLAAAADGGVACVLTPGFYSDREALQRSAHRCLLWIDRLEQLTLADLRLLHARHC